MQNGETQHELHPSSDLDTPLTGKAAAYVPPDRDSVSLCSSLAASASWHWHC